MLSKGEWYVPYTNAVGTRWSFRYDRITLGDCELTFLLLILLYNRGAVVFILASWQFAFLLTLKRESRCDLSDAWASITFCSSTTIK